MAGMKQLALDIRLAADPSLASFLAGPNQALVAHLRLSLQSPLPPPVPTYLWGPSGVGKSHLLRAAAGDLRQQGSSCGWMDASLNEPPAFSDSWAAVLLDDCHLYTPAQQQTAFNWFVNALSAADGRPRWVLAAGQLPPADLFLRDDLRSRLGWGHVFEVHALTDDARREVLRREAASRGLELGDEVIDFMLSRFSRDLGSLMHLLDHLDAFALQTRRAITIPLIKTMLDNE
jgi:DnaA-homolog protein